MLNMKIIKHCSIDNPDNSFSPSTMLVYEDGEIFLGRFSMAFYEDIKFAFNIDVKITDKNYMTNLTIEEAETYGWRMYYNNEPIPIQEVLDLIIIAKALQRENKIKDVIDG